MAPSTLPFSGKKQQTLSSFFTPKPAQPSSTTTRQVRNSINDHDHGQKRNVRVASGENGTNNRPHHESNGNVVEEDFPTPPAKRARTSDASGRDASVEVEGQTSSEAGNHEDEDEDDDGPLRPMDVNRRLPRRSTPKEALKPTNVTDRTSRFLFSSSTLEEDEPMGTSSLPIDSAYIERRADLHRRFVKKLGRPDSMMEIKRRNRALFDDGTGDTQADGEEDDAGADDEEEPTRNANSKGRGAAAKKSTKLTPMEKQVIEIKHAHADTLLVVEVGYKFRFFGEDARIAARELGIFCIPGKLRFDEHPSEAHLDRFAGASIPVHRLHVHVRRLVAAGHKVGVVRQLETAALKAVGDNRNTPFTRKLTNLYTKGTYVDDVEGLIDGDHESSPGPTTPIQSPATGYLLCLTEQNSKGYGNDEKAHVGLVAVQPATGDVIYDDFEDDFMRSEVETRLLHIAPCEILLVGELSKATEKLMLHLSGSKSNVFGDKARVERVERKKNAVALASSTVSTFYASKMAESQSQSIDAGKILDRVLGLPENVTICLSTMITHLTEYGLEHVFDLTKYFQPFSARSHMLLNGNTLSSLEIYLNQTDHTSRGSLFWTLDRTQTRFGSRLLRKWVGRPLLDMSAIEARLDAIGELLDPERTPQAERLRKVLGKTRIDLEKSLIRIYYGKCTRPELLNVLQALQLISSEFAYATSASLTGFDSEVISNAIVSLPSILHEVIAFLDQINLQAAKEDDKYEFFREEVENETITNHRIGITSVEQDLDEFRTTAGEKIGKRKVDYVSVAGIDYLIEVENSSPYLKKVPASWAKISGTKKLSRFHPPEVVRLVRERDQHRESLAAACDLAFKELLTDISSKYQVFRDAVAGLATLDCLCSLAAVASQIGYVRPSFHTPQEGATRINIYGARHPMIEQLLISAYVPNNVELDNSATGTRGLLVTGPNMGGKSSYVRSVALIAIMAQIGSYVPCESADLGVLDAVFTRMGAFDNMMAGESTFMVELGETAEILRFATDRSLVVLDELGRGTSTHDGVAIAGAVLDWLVREKRCLTMFITHYQVLARLADGSYEKDEHQESSHLSTPRNIDKRNSQSSRRPLKNVHMRFNESEDGQTVTFLYEVGEGVAHRSYGLNVARLANVREGIIERAERMSNSMERGVKERALRGVAGRVLGSGTNFDDGMSGVGGAEGGDGEEAAEMKLKRVVEGIEML